MSILADFLEEKPLEAALEEQIGLSEVWPEFEYRGGSPADVRQRLEDRNWPAELNPRFSKPMIWLVWL